MVTIRALNPLSMLRFAGKVDREAALANNAPITLAGAKDALDTFLRGQNGTLKQYEAVGPDVRFEIDRPELSPDAPNVSKKSLSGANPLNPFSLVIKLNDTTSLPKPPQVGYAISRATQHTVTVAMRAFERGGKLFLPASDSPGGDKGVIALDTAMFKASLNLALVQLNPLRTGKGLPADGPGRTALETPEI